MNKTLLKKIARIASNVVLYAFLALCVISLVLSIFMKKDADGAATIAGRQLRIITTDSMARCEETDVSDYRIGSLPVNTMVVVKLVPTEPEAKDAFFRDLEVGDVLTFRYVYHQQVTITHRITSITEKEGGFVIELLGDNTSSESEELYQIIDTSVPNNPNYVIGKVTARSFFLGAAASLLKKPVGLICIVIIPCLIIIALEIIKIISVFSADKKRQKDAEQAQKDEEIAALRAELAKLQQSNTASDSAVAAKQENEEDTTS